MINSVRINKNLYVDYRFFEFLKTYECRVSSLILNFDTIDTINHISIHSFDMISFIPSSKYKAIGDKDPYSEIKFRSNMKVGRLVSKLFPQEVVKQFISSESDIEKFVNYFKSHFDDSNKEIKVVEGEEIRKWYLEDNYLTPSGKYCGTLWKSCMRYYGRQSFLDLYVKNKQFKMLVMIQKDQYGDDKVRSRALLFEAETIDESYLPVNTKVKVMDRIYSIYDSDVNTFKSWAKENGYISKYEQTSNSKVFFTLPDGENKYIGLKLKLDRKDFNSYPYLDTFSYFNFRKGEFFNDHRIEHDYVLVQANGSLEPEMEEDY